MDEKNSQNIEKMRWIEIINKEKIKKRNDARRILSVTKINQRLNVRK